MQLLTGLEISLQTPEICRKPSLKALKILGCKLPLSFACAQGHVKLKTCKQNLFLFIYLGPANNVKDPSKPIPVGQRQFSCLGPLSSYVHISHPSPRF